MMQIDCIYGSKCTFIQKTKKVILRTIQVSHSETKPLIAKQQNTFFVQ